jgi:MerR family transcriptional regulator, redox-sensitive transcriptional activator SoxR
MATPAGDTEKNGQWEIGEVARRSGASRSAIRYYEGIGLLPQPARQSGRRRYDASAVQRLQVIQSAQQAGFSLVEIRTLFFGFKTGIHPETRWEALAGQKLAALEEQQAHIHAMQDRLREGLGCDCATMDECTVWRSGMDTPDQ